MLKELNNNFLNSLKKWINQNPGKSAGVFIGLLMGVFLFTFGVLKALLILLLVLVGYFIGKSRDENVSIIDEVYKFFKKKDE